jgi:hypothetical protein
MDNRYLLKIQNTINEINNQLNKEVVDTSTSKILMQRAIIQLNELITHIGYLENKSQPTLVIDEEWNINFSHGPESNYLVHGDVIKMLVDHIKYMHILIENCPGNKNE